MTKGTKAFRVTICILLALNMLWSAFFGAAFIAYAKYMILTDEYGIWVAGVSVNSRNKGDILGDGTVSYNAAHNLLTFHNANIETKHAIVQSEIELRIQLIGENKVVCKDADYIPAIYAADNYLNKDLSFEGDGSLTLELRNVSESVQGILAQNLTIATDITIIMPDCEKIANGIVCDSSLILADGATVTVNNGAAQSSAAVRIRGNVLLEEGTALIVSTNPGTTAACKGLSINGDLILGKNALVDVSIDDASTDEGECVRVTGALEVGSGATLRAAAKKAHAVECFGVIKANADATVSAATAAQKADVICYGAIVNNGATIQAEPEALGGIHNKSGN